MLIQVLIGVGIVIVLGILGVVITACISAGRADDAADRLRKIIESDREGDHE